MYTPGFAAPEMYRRETQLGPWTDIYAIGACMYSMMIGYPPPEVVKRRANDPVPGMLLKKASANYSDKLIEVVEWCMSLDPLDRPQSVFELQSALANYRADA
jgi:serine/threonine protein kinase